MTTASVPGQIITFYSYKGGTGRSMALANVGFLLAQRQSQSGGRGVLLVDWDLEAPGLHRYFQSSFRRRFGVGDEFRSDFDNYPGLIDLFWHLGAISEGLPQGSIEISDESELQLRSKIRFEDFVLETDIERLHFLKAGRFDDDYPKRVNTFAWEDLYNRTPWLIPWFANWLAEHYEYVLIDSRTGITDTSGICTTLLPEKLVIVFTPNLQSTEGALGLIERATSYRRRSDDLRPLVVFPLPSRVEAARESLRNRWRFDSKIGYQPRFEGLFRKVYSLSKYDLTEYFDEIQIQHVPDYAYGEEVAAMTERGDRLSLARSYERFTDWLLNAGGPWEKPGLTQTLPAVSDGERRAFAIFAQMTPEKATIAKRSLLRLVRVAPAGQSQSDVGVRVREGDFPASVGPVIQELVSAGLLRADAGDGLIGFADDAIVQTWGQLKSWVEEDRKFLSWRQRLDDNITHWRSGGLIDDFLWRGVALREAQRWSIDRSDDLNEAEKDFIAASSRAQRKNLISRVAFMGTAVGVMVLAIMASMLINLAAETSYVEAVQLLDSKTGWALSWSTTDIDLILSTKDGGKTWSQELSNLEGPKSVYFLNPSTGWIAGRSGILATTDSGATWKQQANEMIDSVFFSDARKGWAVGGGNFLATIDGGRTWNQQKMVATDANLKAVHFPDPKNGWIVGYGGLVLATSDSGKTWKRQDISRNVDLESVHFVNSVVGWAVGDEREGGAVIFSTQDGGRQWIRQQAPSSVGFRDVYFVTPKNGWVVGYSGVLMTIDGGKSWIDQSSPYYLHTVHFIDARVGWAAGLDVILSTMDGGQTWKQIWKAPE